MAPMLEMGIVLLSAHLPQPYLAGEQWSHCQLWTPSMTQLFPFMYLYTLEINFYLRVTLAAPLGMWPGRGRLRFPTLEAATRAPAVASSWLGPWWELASWWRRKQGKSVGEQRVRAKPSTGDEVKPPHWPHPFLPEQKERQMKSKWE